MARPTTAEESRILDSRMEQDLKKNVNELKKSLDDLSATIKGVFK
jgi:hypothetical protein